MIFFTIFNNYNEYRYMLVKFLEETKKWKFYKTYNLELSYKVRQLWKHKKETVKLIFSDPNQLAIPTLTPHPRKRKPKPKT